VSAVASFQACDYDLTRETLNGLHLSVVAGKGGAKRHRKVLRDNIQGITVSVAGCG
jgi:hypothetical protein